MRSASREARARKSLIFCALGVLAASAVLAENRFDPAPDAGWIQSPYRNFGAPHSVLPGRVVLFDEAHDPALVAELSAELRRLYSDLYGAQGWRYPFSDNQPVRVFVARKEAEGVRRVAARAREGWRFVSPAVLLDAAGWSSRQIVREVSRQIALATLSGYGVSDRSFVTEAAAGLIAGAGDDSDRDAALVATAAPELSVESSPRVLGRLYLEELTRAAGPGLLRAAWERAADTGEPILGVLLATYAERSGESDAAALVRFGARLYTLFEPEAAPSRVGLSDLESGALDAAAPAPFTLRHRTYLPGDGASALRVTWPEDGGAGAIVVRYRDPALPADVAFVSAGETRTVPLGGVSRVDWVVAGGVPGSGLRAPAAFEALQTYPYAGLTAQAAGGPEGPKIWWNTATHEGMAGWAIFREEVLSDGRIARTGPEILPASESAQESFAYAYVDPATGPATYYRYTVWAVTRDGLLSRAFSVTLRTAE